MKIMLDAGHGYNEPGKRSPDGMKEYEFNRVVANYAKQFLEGYENVTVYFAHSDDRVVPLQERTDKANQLNVDCYVSIHANAYGNTWNDAGGIETYIYPTRPAEAAQLAAKIQRNLVASTGLKDRGVKTADFHVLRETKMTAVLAECGFMTNPEEIKLLRSDSYRKTCADAITRAVAEQYRLTKKPAPPPPPAGIGLYKVQVGAFKDRNNAEALADRLRKDGYEPFIYFE
ncbi:N-acetylmuramoyl-L-alanine amidase [Bacillus sp. T33-2]|uniref:N-acetylmuramoyl-L-alanine amidase n=1 Tax=Bacillus sp. T33-2 TaxID=2054168 RepID=UPI000C768331|nr:N-acetylmuramoyl-L-alanine amidase [Bacillus sp. T33-2]PLR99109.1 N-acetylmuramoyl-L-alanine amidase [Bacillus sp. T33-2]